MELAAQQILYQALQLPIAERSAVVAVLESSLQGDDVHGPVESADEVGAVWDAEIARRIHDLESGQVAPITSTEMWSMIEKGTRPGN